MFVETYSPPRTFTFPIPHRIMPIFAHLLQVLLPVRKCYAFCFSTSPIKRRVLSTTITSQDVTNKVIRIPFQDGTGPLVALDVSVDRGGGLRMYDRPVYHIEGERLAHTLVPRRYSLERRVPHEPPYCGNENFDVVDIDPTSPQGGLDGLVPSISADHK